MGPNGDLMGTQKLKKVPMGTRVSKWGPMWEQCGPPNHNFLQKDLIFFLNFILEGHFEICWLKIACFRALYSELWAKQTTFGMKRGGGYLCFVDSCGAIAVTEGLPPLQSIYTGF